MTKTRMDSKRLYNNLTLYFRLNMDELFKLVLLSFEEECVGKSEESLQLIKKFIMSLTRDIMMTLDVRKEGSLDVSNL
jgi:hypothetical protein